MSELFIYKARTFSEKHGSSMLSRNFEMRTDAVFPSLNESNLSLTLVKFCMCRSADALEVNFRMSRRKISWVVLLSLLADPSYHLQRSFQVRKRSTLASFLFTMQCVATFAQVIWILSNTCDLSYNCSVLLLSLGD